MIEVYLRPFCQRIIFSPLAVLLAKYSNVHPNSITILAGMVGVGVVPALYFHQQYVAISLILLSGLMDILDGSLARLTEQTSSWGAYLDIFTDRFVESCILLGIYFYYPQHGLLVILMLISILLCVTSFLLAGLFVANEGEKGFHYSIGLIERAEAFIFFILMILFEKAFVGLSILFVCSVTFTSVVRAREVRQSLG
jgi:archaetidylinositol phosphate synthase